MAAGDVAVSNTKVRAFDCNLFNGVDDYVEIPHNANQLGANLSNGFTISAWINSKSLGEGGTGRIVDKSTSSTGGSGFGLSLVTIEKLRLRINGSTEIYSNASSIILGTWQHILVQIKSNSATSFYINGNLSGSADQAVNKPISDITTTNPIRIGQRSFDTGSTFDGSIRDVKMWNRVLTTAEITADYEGSPNTLGLIHHFKLG